MAEIKELRFLSLNKKLLSIVVLVAILFTIFWTFANIVQTKSLNEELEIKRLEYLESTLLPGITISAWNIDMAQLHIQLEGILQNPNILRVSLTEIKSADKPLFDKKKMDTYSDISVKEYPLYSPTGTGLRNKFATLSVYSTNAKIAAQLKSDILVTLASEGLEIFLLSVVFFYFFKLLVTNHLAAISQFFQNNPYFSQTTPEITTRKKGFSDEIDTLISHINASVAASKKYQTEIETLKDRAEDANRTKSIFLANINHELRTPLNSILGVTELLPQTPDANKQKALIELQTKASLHLRHLIDEILDLSKIEAREVKIEFKVINLRNIIESCRQLTEFDFKEKNNQIAVSFSESFPPLIMGDEFRISQIVLNLINNANKFTNNGEIKIHVQDSGDQFSIKVSDTGIGIAQDKLEHIFVPFKQIESKLTTKIKGYGIGLSITKALAELMNGSIDVESQLGKGSVFTTRLPLILPSAEIIEKPEPKTETAKLEKNASKILAVEDTEEIRFIIGEFLQDLDFQLTFAVNGKEAVEYFQKESFSLILMDLQMPIMNGYDATREIRRLEKINNKGKTPIIAVTAYTTKTELDMALAAGCDGYITKPFSKSKLLKSIEFYLAAASLNETIREENL